MKFSELFSNFTDFSKSPKNFYEFYQSYTKQIIKVKLPITKFNQSILSKKIESIQLNNIFDEHYINIHSISPSNQKNKIQPIIIVLPDYTQNNFSYRHFYELQYKQYIIEPRNQKINIEYLTSKKRKNNNLIEEPLIQKFSQVYEQIEQYYMFQLYMDGYHALQTIKRMIIDPQKQPLYLFGQGTGANVVLFLAAFNKDIKKIFIDSPKYNNLDIQLKYSEAVYIKKLRELFKNQAEKPILQAIHTYLDSAYFVPHVKQPIGMHLTLSNARSLDKANFALFHACISPKEMFISTGEINKNTQAYLFDSAKSYFHTTI